MPGRFLLHTKTVRFTVAALCAGSLLTFFFYDGPSGPRLSDLEATAQAFASEPELALTTPIPTPKNAADSFLPRGYQAEWIPVILDKRVAITVLDKPFQLSQTENRVGGEYYDYTAYLYEQLAEQLPDSTLSHQLKNLSLQAQTMGHALREASSREYSGAPTQDMTHLKVRSAILFQLNRLNQNALVTVRYDQNGHVLDSSPARDAQPGDLLSAFMDNSNAILSSPNAKHYPQTMQLVRQHRDLLQKLSTHLTLRWESTVYCSGRACGNAPTRLDIYTRQTLSEKTIAATI